MARLVCGVGPLLGGPVARSVLLSAYTDDGAATTLGAAWLTLNVQPKSAVGEIARR